MKSAVLATGSELTTGVVVDTNTSFLAGHLFDRGAPVIRAMQVPDDREVMAETLRLLAERADLLFVTGGLGPTVDDFTSEVISRTFDRPLYEDPLARAGLEARFRLIGRRLPDNNLRQALVPAGAAILPNQHGTACGYRLDLPTTRLFVMPGVPAEMKPMFTEQVLPWLEEELRLKPRERRRLIKTIGIAESQLDQMLAGVEIEGVEIGYRYHFPENHLTLKARERADAEAALDEAEREIRAIVGRAVFTVGDREFEEVVGEMLRQAGLRIALAESCTGGLVAKRLTDVPGSSAFLDFSAVVYSNEAKTRLLGVPPELIAQHGAVSGEVARAMAEGARTLRDVDLAVAITGIAGPDGGSAAKPVGTVFIAVARRGRPTTIDRYAFWGERERIRLAAATAALNLIRLALLSG